MSRCMHGCAPQPACGERAATTPPLAVQWDAVRQYASGPTVAAAENKTVEQLDKELNKTVSGEPLSLLPHCPAYPHAPHATTSLPACT